MDTYPEITITKSVKVKGSEHASDQYEVPVTLRFHGADLEKVAEKASRSIVIDEQRKMRADLANGIEPEAVEIDVAATLVKGSVTRIITKSDVQNVLAKMTAEERAELLAEYTGSATE